jgi:hypothetical protein
MTDGGLVKNPNRVPSFSQIDDPKGRQPAPHHLIDINETETVIMSDREKATKTGVYKDEADETFIRVNEGDLVPDGFTYSHEDETFKNTTAEDVDPNVRAMNAAPENRMESAPDNRSARDARAKDSK